MTQRGIMTIPAGGIPTTIEVETSGAGRITKTYYYVVCDWFANTLGELRTLELAEGDSETKAADALVD